MKSLKPPLPLKSREKSPGRKKWLSSIVVSVVLIFIIMSVFVYHRRQKLQEEINANGFALTDMAARQSSMGLGQREADIVIQIIGLLGSRSGLVYGMIMDGNGRVISHTDAALAGHLLDDPVALRAASSINPLKQVYKDPDAGSTIYEFSRPLFSGGEKAGVVRLGFSRDAHPLFSDADIPGLFLIAALALALVPVLYSSVRRAQRLPFSVPEELDNVPEENDTGNKAEQGVEKAEMAAGTFLQAISQYQETCQKLKASCEELEVANSVLLYEKERIESVIDGIDDGIMVRDLLGSIIHVNRAMGYLMKLSRQSVIGKTIQDCINNEDIISFIERNQRSGGSSAQKNLKITLKQHGGEKMVLISYLPLLNHEESVLGSVIIARDITAERMAQQNQADFIAHVSHELRTPLTTITSYVEMLMDNEIAGEDARIDFYNTINDEANRLSRLISNLLNMSKIETGSLTINKDMIKPPEFFEDILHSIEPQAISRNISLTSTVPDKLSPLVVDKDLLRLAILNILGNAIKYTPPGGSITFKAVEDERRVEIHIADTGYGISEEELPHIFDKFFRSSDENIKKQTGNGLGLSLSKEIIRLHDGKIGVTSIPGQGTHFTLTLPREGSPRISSYSKRLSSLMENT